MQSQAAQRFVRKARELSAATSPEDIRAWVARWHPEMGSFSDDMAYATGFGAATAQLAILADFVEALDD